MVLSDSERAAVVAKWLREKVGSLAVTKADVRAAVDGIDAWVDANAAAFNTAIPQPARGSLTAKQKAMLLFYVVLRRFEVI